MFPCLDLESKLCQGCRTNDDVTYILLLHYPGDKNLYNFFFCRTQHNLGYGNVYFCDLVSLLPGGSY